MAGISGGYFSGVVQFADVVLNPAGKGFRRYAGKGAAFVRGVSCLYSGQGVTGQLAGNSLPLLRVLKRSPMTSIPGSPPIRKPRKAITDTAAAS
jgi:hypothetical protein